ncbi:MAG: hypothetical protein KC621_35160 [Myxococcales bacterium]|nr:hypothetical protein [Myxococcales bacterium]
MPEVIVFAGLTAVDALAPWTDEDAWEARPAGGSLANALGSLSCSTSYRADAPSHTQVAHARRAADALDLGAALSEGLEDWAAGRIRPWTGGPLGALGRVARAAADPLDALDADALAELGARPAVTREGLRVVTTPRWQAWIGGATLLALTPTPPDEVPVGPPDTPCALPVLDPEGSPGTWVLRGMGHRLIDAETAGDWRERLAAIRAGWSRDAGWRYVAVVFPRRQDAVALAAEKLRRLYVYGWYRDGDLILEPSRAGTETTS